NQELPRILKRRRADGRVFWIPIRKVPGDLLQKAELSPIQAMWSPSKPLQDLNPTELEDALTAIASELMRQIDLPRKPRARRVSHQGARSGWRRRSSPRRVFCGRHLFDVLSGEAA